MIDIPDFVYPKDPQGQPLCPRCRKLVGQCDCPGGELIKLKAPAIKPVIRLDRSGRKGKVVTLITSLPRIEKYLKDLSKELKVKTGSGGTFYFNETGGVVELQGDHQQMVRDFFLRKHHA